MSRRGALACLLLALAPAAAAGHAAAANPRTGRAFVLSGADGSLLRTLTAPDVQDGAFFGLAVTGIGDVSGDTVPDLAVSAPTANEGSVSSVGRVHIFSGADGSLLRTISDPNARAGVRFGFSLAATGDLDADGFGDLVVGAPRGRDPGSRRRTGRAYTFSGDDGMLIASLDLDPNLQQRGARFGWSVAAGRDLDGDGVGEILVGAPGRNVKTGSVRRPDEGRVHVFSGTGGLIAGIGDPEPQSFALFGDSVAFADDADADGVADVVVGADGQDLIPGDFAGRVFLVTGDPNALALADSNNAPQDVLIQNRPAPLAQPFSNFGFAVAGLPDLDGDGMGDFAASAPDQFVTQASEGLGFVMRGLPVSVLATDPNLTLQTITDPAPHRIVFFGGSLAALPDLTSDGLAEVAVGAELHRDPNSVRAGRVYVYEAATGAIHLTIESPTGDSCARFGWSVALAGDVDGDTVADILVGAPLHHLTTIQARNDCF